jgi:hypothetical protein
MGALPPSGAREFEELIMVPHGGIEYMAGGTSFHPTIGSEPWSAKGKATATPKAKPPGEEEKANQPHPSPPRRGVLDNADLVIHG